MNRCSYTVKENPGLYVLTRNCITRYYHINCTIIIHGDVLELCIYAERNTSAYLNRSWSTDMTFMIIYNNVYQSISKTCTSEILADFHNERCTYTCDWIWENPVSSHNYKYLEILILIIWNIITWEGKQMLSWNSPRF